MKHWADRAKEAIARVRAYPARMRVDPNRAKDVAFEWYLLADFFGRGFEFTPNPLHAWGEFSDRYDQKVAPLVDTYISAEQLANRALDAFKKPVYKAIDILDKIEKKTYMSSYDYLVLEGRQDSLQDEAVSTQFELNTSYVTMHQSLILETLEDE